MKLLLKAGATSQKATVFIQDTTSSAGAGLTGLAWNTGSLTAYYYREGDASATAIALATMTLGTWSTAGFVVVDGTNAPGTYQIGIPNAAISAVGSVTIYLKGAANMAPCVLEIQCVAFDPTDAVRLGLTALPSAAVGSGANSFNLDASGNIKSLLADAVAHGGTLGSSTATLALKNVNITSTGGVDTLVIACQHANNNAVNISSAGGPSSVGAGIVVTGAAHGDAVTLTSGTTAGNALSLISTAGNALNATVPGGQAAAKFISDDGAGTTYELAFGDGRTSGLAGNQAALTANAGIPDGSSSYCILGAFASNGYAYGLSAVVNSYPGEYVECDLAARSPGSPPQVVGLATYATNDTYITNYSATLADTAGYDMNLAGNGQLHGDLTGKVLGSGSGVFVGDGAQVSIGTAGVAAVWSYLIDSTYTAKQYLRAIGATAAGSCTATPTHVTFVTIDGTSVVQSTVDNAGDRTNLYAGL